MKRPIRKGNNLILKGVNRKTSMTIGKQPFEDVCPTKKMVMFRCHVSLRGVMMSRANFCGTFSEGISLWSNLVWGGCLLKGKTMARLGNSDDGNGSWQFWKCLKQLTTHQLLQDWSTPLCENVTFFGDGEFTWPFKMVAGDLQRYWGSKGHGLNHLAVLWILRSALKQKKWGWRSANAFGEARKIVQMSCYYIPRNYLGKLV